MVSRPMAEYGRREPDFYMSPAVQGLYRPLERQGHDGEVTRGGDYTGAGAPVWADTRASHGHWHLS